MPKYRRYKYMRRIVANVAPLVTILDILEAISVNKKKTQDADLIGRLKSLNFSAELETLTCRCQCSGWKNWFAWSRNSHDLKHSTYLGDKTTLRAKTTCQQSVSIVERSHKLFLLTTDKLLSAKFFLLSKHTWAGREKKKLEEENVISRVLIKSCDTPKTLLQHMRQWANK